MSLATHALAPSERLAFPGIASGRPLEFRAAVLRGLFADEAYIPCQFLYDERGSDLFDQICELPEYYPTRTELALTKAFAPEIAEVIGARAQVIEPGAGSSTKVRHLLDALPGAQAYLPVDISGEHLQRSAARLADDYPHIQIEAATGDFTRAFDVHAPRARGRRVIYFPGSTIGNFEPAEAKRLLASFRTPLAPDDLVLMGWDCVKPESVLVPAYADSAGVTEAFIRNLLVRVRDELGAKVEPMHFELLTQWQPDRERIRISLRATRDTSIAFNEVRRDFTAGECIFVEHSHKYSDLSMSVLVRDAGLHLERSWTDPKGWFALSILRVPG
jgi:dimethylhistidine N-methyltransferase